jgi:hypothetical protein
VVAVARLAVVVAAGEAAAGNDKYSKKTVRDSFI